MFLATVIEPSALTVTFDTGITPIPPSNLTNESSAARAADAIPRHTRHATANIACFIATLPLFTNRSPARRHIVELRSAAILCPALTSVNEIYLRVQR